jgi:hypothetical protein
VTGAVMAGESDLRAHVYRGLSDHLSALGYTNARGSEGGEDRPEIVRMNPVRGRIAYGETVLRSDLRQSSCHRRLMAFSQRRTRRRSSILFFIGVVEAQRGELEHLLMELGIRSAVGGGHVHVVPIAVPHSTHDARPRP